MGDPRSSAKRPRVLFIAPLSPPVTGQSLASDVLLEALRQSHDVTLVNLSKPSLRSGNLAVGRISSVLQLLLQIARARTSADIIYLTISESVAGNLRDLLVYMICWNQLGRLVVHLHGGSLRRRLFDPHPWVEWINRLFLRRIGAAIILGRSHAGILQGVVPRERLHIIGNFAQDDLFVTRNHIAAKFDEPAVLHLLFLSNLIDGKGYRELLAGYQALSEDERQGTQLHFAGAFESAAERERFIAECGKGGNVTYHGVVGGDAKRLLLQRAHALILPSSLYEGQPISILEAYAAGCVVLTTARGGIPDIFSAGENGFLVRPGDAASIRDAIREAIGNLPQLETIAAANLAKASSAHRASDYAATVIDLMERVRTAEEARTMTVGSSESRPMPPRAHEPGYRICQHCIMDTSDSKIVFDERGFCDYCCNFEANIAPHWHPDAASEAAMDRQMETIRRDGRGRDFDCLIGVSGGVDSSYVTHLAKEKWGLRPLLFHVDAGWNSQQAVHNIEALVEGIGVDLYTEVVDWEEMRDLQRAFFLAQVPHIDTPQDHAFFGGLYRFAAKHKMKYILTGANYSTECVREPLEWHYHASDLRQLRAIHRAFGRIPLKSFPLSSIFEYKIYFKYVKGVRVIEPLNAVPYRKEHAMRVLVDKYGWQEYAHKHYESRFTRFYEGYWLPTKFGYDKRRAHFSSLILTGQLSREEALRKISQNAYDAETIAEDFEYIATKLDLSVSELRAIMTGPNKSYRDYDNSARVIAAGTTVMRALGVQRGLIR